MSDDERSDGESESGDDLSNTGLVATRQKRATAGNFYASLLANIDDEELQKELLAEDEEDLEDYASSDKDAGDDDDAFDSSSDDEDAGPPQDGQQEELDGEKALKRQERNEAKRKRKAHEARLKIPALRKITKKVKLADDVKTDDGSATGKPKKKSERSNWLPSASDAPIRQSGRSSAVANREVIHANLKQSAARSEAQKRIMKNAAEREKTEKYMASLTQEERLKKCERIERETAKEFGRWEREEAERQRARDEALAAKRRKGFDGPMIRHWSGSVLWEGEKVKIKRLEHGSQSVQDIREDREPEQEAPSIVDDRIKQVTPAGGSPLNAASERPLSTATEARSSAAPTDAVQKESANFHAENGETSAHPQVPWLQGIQEYAAQPLHQSAEPNYTPSAPSINGTTKMAAQQAVYPPQVPQLQSYHGWPPGSHQFMVEPQSPAVPHIPAVPLIREQARRSLLILSAFPSLATPPNPTKRISKSKALDLNPLEPNPLTTALFSSAAYPALTADERTYLVTRPRKRLVPGSNGRTEVPLPAPPAKQRCAVTSWPAKFRDPKTGLAYADMHQYKVIQRVLLGGTAWSGLLGSWVGPRYGVLGRPAKGVPPGFGDAKVALVKREVA